MAENERGGAGTAPESQSVGQLLKQARVALDLSVEQLSTELRIEARQLQALEEDRFERIGVPVFIKGYIRGYGQRLGLDYGDLLAVYYRQVAVHEVDIRPSRSIKMRDARQITIWIVAAVALVAVAVGLAVWWWSSAPSAAKAPPATSVVPRREAPAVAGSPRVAPAPEAQPIVAEETPARAEPVAATAAPSSPPPAAERVAEPAAERAAATTSAPPDPSAPSAEIELTFDEDSWVEISDARGERLYFDNGQAGSHALMRGEPPFSVLFGNAPGVRVALDGEPYDVPPRRGKLAHFTLEIPEE